VKYYIFIYKNKIEIINNVKNNKIKGAPNEF